MISSHVIGFNLTCEHLHVVAYLVVISVRTKGVACIVDLITIVMVDHILSVNEVWHATYCRGWLSARTFLQWLALYMITSILVLVFLGVVCKFRLALVLVCSSKERLGYIAVYFNLRNKVTYFRFNLRSNCHSSLSVPNSFCSHFQQQMALVYCIKVRPMSYLAYR